MKDIVETAQSDSEKMIEIRDAALAHLLDRKIKFNTRRAKRTLNGIAERIRRKQSIEYLEANILTRIAGGAPVRRVQNEFNHLFHRCIAAGDAERFEGFKDNLRAAEQKGANLDGISYPVSFQHLDEDLVWEQTGAVMAQIRDLLGDVWLNSGTLLGSVRDNGLIKHDNDVDLALMLDAKSQEEAAEKWVDAYRTLSGAGMDMRAPSRNLRVFKFKGAAVKIDLFPAWMEKGKVWVYPHTAGELAKKDLYPLGKCQKTGLAIPKNPEAFLELNYGKGWKVPDPGFVFSWNRANRNFEPMREILYADGIDWSVQNKAGA